ncbi:MBL fold metallo-hydrolase [Rugamonas sp.]|uniref:MBL fold metallo-hydrolase n=1 Tax=Rugamonas sp. TaxID=1926287 RepID=UPI0025E5B2FC|nr:MBL fold metallo-hydrolase [Rugamonas sp.]
MTLKISRILHAGYVFECEGTAIAFDPIVENPFSRNCHAFPAVAFDHGQIRQLKLAAVFISHFHDDHCSFDSLDLLDRRTPIYLYCQFDQLFDMIRELGLLDVHALRTDTPVHIGPYTVTPREALDTEVDSLFHIHAAGLNVLNVVDSWIAPDTLATLARSAPWDMVLWPFQTMREIEVIAPSRTEREAAHIPAEWLDQLRLLNPRYIVPSSCQFVQEPWSWYNHAMFPITYRQFGREVGAALPGATIVQLSPSVSVELDRDTLTPAAPLPWVHPVGPQDVDYAYDQHIAAPATADIARRFAPLAAAQAELVHAYCRAGLLDKYRAMELPEDSYFEQPRHWQLALYDHAGALSLYHYRVEGDTITPLPVPPPALSWTTQLPLAKLYAALALGESLTSMYLRINDTLFDSATEAEVQSADIVDDPLIRCLFNDAFGAYQAAQLKRIQGRRPA